MKDLRNFVIRVSIVDIVRSRMQLKVKVNALNRSVARCASKCYRE